MNADRQGEEISWNTLVEISKRAGLPLMGGFNLKTSDFGKEKKYLKIWQESGFAGEMAYMNRSEELLGSPDRLLPNAKSVVSFGLPYSSAPHPELKRGFGRVARYAWGKDYHEIFPHLLSEFLKQVELQLKQKFEFRYFSDAVPLLERACAEKGGVGFVGKNTLIIKPGVGSFFFLGEIIWDATIVELPELPSFVGCSTCTRCLDACPTNAFSSSKVLDARKCISYLSIEKKGMHRREERSYLGEWLFGCDVCQEVCPFNHKSIEVPKEIDPNFNIEAGVGPLISLQEIFELKDDGEFKRKFKGTPLIRPKREGLLRNAIAVAVNTQYFESETSLIRLFQTDSSEIVRATALWGIYSFKGREKSLPYLERGVQDISQHVRNEAFYLLESTDASKI